MELVLSCVFCALIFAAAVWYTRMKTRVSTHDVPAYPSKSFPLIGSAHLFRGSREEIFTKYSKIALQGAAQGHGIASFRLGPLSLLIVISPVYAEEILRSNRLLKKSYFYSFLDTWIGTGLLTAGGEKWKTRRRLLNPTFHSSLLHNFLGVMNEQAKIFASSVSKNAETRKIFDISKHASLCSLDIICETTMGKAINAQKNENLEYIEAIHRVNEAIQDRQKSPWLWPNFIFNHTRRGKEYARNVAILHEFTQMVLQNRMKSFEHKNGPTAERKRMAFLDLLLTEMNLGNISLQGVQEEVDTFMFAGHDTTATAISWTLHMIGHHPQVQRRIQEELDEIFRGDVARDVTVEDTRRLLYMEMVIKETLRRFPSVPVIGRTIETECVLGDYKIPAGTECVMIPYVINNNEQYWDEPFKFDPERFRAESSQGRHPYAFLPFSAGPRNCIGQRFALMEEKVVLCHLLRRFSVESCEHTEDLLLLGDIILKSKNGIKVRLTAR